MLSTGFIAQVGCEDEGAVVETAEFSALRARFPGCVFADNTEGVIVDGFRDNSARRFGGSDWVAATVIEPPSGDPLIG